MARFGIHIKGRRKSSIGGFHAEYIDTGASMLRKPLGLARTIFTGFSLAMGAIMFYVALHYLPALIQPQKLLAMSNNDTAASRLDNSDSGLKFITPYIDAFRLKRTYLRGGQTIQAQYVLPKGATLDLYITQCRRAWIIEVFACQALSREHVQITNDTLGTKAYRFPATGFYFFEDQVTLPLTGGDYRVIWSRK